MTSVALAVVLVLTSIVLVIGHLRAWRAADHGGLGEQEREFHSRRFRRRVQASAMLGVIGLLLVGDLWLRTGWPALLYWSGVLLLLGWLLLLAVSDWLASRVHFRQQINRLQGERALIQADLDRLRNHHRSRTEPPPTDSDEH
ncbi:hypothetical protein NA78x_004701 [Anatilimnocola sp. NA78]|uniref:hypothetical protein n=1 Tax=Anatilimnocola sp. NA78 TaxID=3415683 RepID=UPI003CE54642